MLKWFVFVTVLVWSAPVSAQDDAAYDGPSLLNGADASVKEGKRYFGAYLNGRVSVGSLTLTVSSDEKAGHGVTTDWQMRVNDATFSRRVTATLDGALALVDWKEVLSEGKGEAAALKTTYMRIDKGNRWVAERTHNGAVIRAKLKVKKRQHHGELEALLALVPNIAMADPGVYRFSEIVNGLSDMPTESPLDWGYFDVQIHESSEFTHRCGRYDVRVVRAIWNPERAMSFVVSTEGELLAFWSENVPLRFVLGNADQVKFHMPIAEGIVRETDPRSAIRTLLQVMAGALHFDKLDDVIDWTSVIDNLSAKSGKKGDAATVAAFRTAVRERLKNATPPFGVGDIPLLIGMLDVVHEEGFARIQLDTDNEPYVLMRSENRWWIVGLPE